MHKEKYLRITAIVLLIILGPGALIGGWLLISDPSGQKIGFAIELLESTPFNNYLVPGVILFITIGLFSISIIITTWLKTKYYHLFIILEGFILVGWLTIELIYNPDFFLPALHFPFYAIGILLILDGMFLAKYLKNNI
jgi:hypothetical protein